MAELLLQEVPESVTADEAVLADLAAAQAEAVPSVIAHAPATALTAAGARSAPRPAEGGAAAGVAGAGAETAAESANSA